MLTLIPRSLFTRTHFLLILSMALLPALFTVAHADDEYVEGEILIRYRIDTLQTDISRFEAEQGLIRIQSFDLIRTYHYRLPDTLSTQQAVEQFFAHELLEWSEPNYIRHAQAIPNDPAFKDQWGLHNTGQAIINRYIGLNDADIDWPEAMDIYTGTEDITVAVIDTGVALQHAELRNQLWRKSAELNGLDNTDDDSNGLIDDVFGWDFVNDDNDPEDYNGHGSVVASIIASPADNQKGTAGIAPHASIMSLRVLDSTGRGYANPESSVTSFISALSYAANNGARIINYSAGSSGYSQFEYEIILALESNGILLVAAAGNGLQSDNDQTPIYPASYDADNIISVAASNPGDSLSSYSNFGKTSVDLAAPGELIVGAAAFRRHRPSAIDQDFEGDVAASEWLHGPTGESMWATVSVNNNTWITDSLSAEGADIHYANNSDTWALSPRVDLSNIVGGNLVFDAVYSFAAGDGMFVEIREGSGDWIPLLYIYAVPENGGVEEIVVDISEFNSSQAQFRFHVITNETGTDYGIALDNIRLTEAVPGYPNDAYIIGSGTSYAAPMVTGVLAMMMSQAPELPSSTIRQLVLDNVDKRAPFTNRVVSGGRLNAHRALQAVKNYQTAPASRLGQQASTTENKKTGVVHPLWVLGLLMLLVVRRYQSARCY